SKLSKLNIEQNACIYHFGASVIHGQRSNILRLRMMKSIVEEKLVSFKLLEQKVFAYVCELGRMITQTILENYDDELARERDKKVYRDRR
ncbi:MAG: hypothetical protein E7K23_14485, partial [Lachnospiraceae bacterium]|nr:hypothetical protein [Lachnospiraceae bacterium]